MSVDSISASGVFRVGEVMGRAWRLFTGNLLFVLYFVMVAAFVFFGLMFGFAGWASDSTGVMGTVGVIIALCLTMIGQGVFLLGAFQRLRGERLRVGEMLQRVLARLMPLLGLSILWSLALLLAVAVSAFIISLLIAGLGAGHEALVLIPAAYVPSMVLLVIWAVIIPACVVEGLGPIGSMNRSARLTKGYRWKIFGIMLLLGLLSLAGLLVQAILSWVSPALGAIFAIISFIVWIAYWNCIVIMTYHALRVAKEGVDTAQIAAIFD